jgi:hypothetical protein
LFNDEFFRENVGVVIKGSVEAKDYSYNIQVPKLMAILQQGDLLGAGYRDKYMMERLHVWFECASDIRIIYCDKTNFHVSFFIY